MKMNIVRYSLMNKTIEHVNTAKISSFLPSYLQELIDTIPDDNYILGVQYSEKNDVQVGITGTSNIRENWKRTLTRELGEEVKLYPKFLMLESLKVYKENRRHWFCCKLNVDNTEKSIKQDFYIENHIRDWKRKIGILVYGEYDKLMNILETNYKEYIDNDNISHIVIINAGVIKKYMDIFSEQWFKSKNDKIISKDYFHL